MDTTTNGPSAFEQRLGEVLAQPGGLSSDDTARRAAETSREVRARIAEVAAAAALVDQAIVGYFPRLTTSARYTRLNPLPAADLGTLAAPAPSSGVHSGVIPPGTPLVAFPFQIPVLENQTTFQASLIVPLSDYILRVSQNRAAATHSRRAAELNVLATRLRIAFDARVSYWNWVRAQLAVIVADQAIGQARGHLADVRNLFNAGSVSQADVMRVESQVASAELLLTRAQGLTDVSAEQVRTVIHVDPGTSIAVGEDVRIDLASVAPTDFAAAYQQALANRPELVALAETVGSLRDQASVARAAAWPRLDAFADAYVANPNQRVFPPSDVFTPGWDVGVGLTWSPNDTAAGLAATRNVEARAAAIEAQRDAVRDQLRAEVMAAIAATRESETAVRTTAAGLAAAEESYRVRRVLFRNGRATSVELTDAETDLTRTRLESLNARVDLRISRSRLDHVLGRDVPR